MTSLTYGLSLPIVISTILCNVYSLEIWHLPANSIRRQSCTDLDDCPDYRLFVPHWMPQSRASYPSFRSLPENWMDRQGCEETDDCPDYLGPKDVLRRGWGGVLKGLGHVVSKVGNNKIVREFLKQGALEVAGQIFGDTALGLINGDTEN